MASPAISGLLASCSHRAAARWAIRLCRVGARRCETTAAEDRRSRQAIEAGRSRARGELTVGLARAAGERERQLARLSALILLLCRRIILYNDTRVIYYNDISVIFNLRRLQQMSPKITQQQREEKRRQILIAARRVFDRMGYKAATMKDVVEESGLSRGGVYLYYGSTEEMILAILDEIDERDEHFFEQAIASGGSAWQAIEQLLAQMGTSQEEDSLTVALLEYYLENGRDEEKRRLQARRYERVVAFVEAFLKKGTERGEFAPLLSTELIARMLVSINEGVHIDSLIIGTEALRVPEQAAGFSLMLRHLLQVQNEEERSSDEGTV